MTHAQRLVKLPGCWRGGMLVLQHGVPARLVGQDHLGRWIAWDRSGVWVRYTDMTDIVPDLADPATIGCLATWCRKVYGLHMYASTDGGYWYVSALYPDGADVWGMSPAWRVVTEGHDTEGDAWAAAILAKLEPK